MKKTARPRLTGGTLLLLLAIVALGTFWYAKRVWTSPGNDISPMPDSEFANNEALALPQGGLPLAYEEIAVEHFIELLKSYEVPARLYWEVETTVFGGSASRTRRGILTRTGGNYELSVSEGGRQVRTVSKRGGTVTIDGTITVGYSDSYAPLRQLGMADIEYLLKVDPASVTAVGWTELDSRQVLYVALKDPDIAGMTEYYWVSIELGLPLRCETYEGDRLTYLAKTAAVSVDEDVPRDPPADGGDAAQPEAG